jgi:hypothetical protein
MPLTERVTTHISADTRKLYEESFLAEPTPTSGTEVASQTRPRSELWRQLAPLVRHPTEYDPTIIRFYEDVITDLQRELVKYKAMVIELLKTSAPEDEVEYSLGQTTALPRDVASRLGARTRPPSPMLGHEI